MKVLYSAAAALLAGASCTSAFAPMASVSIPSRTVEQQKACTSSSTCLAMNLPFFAQQQETKSEKDQSESESAVALPSEQELDSMSMEEEIELLVQKELSKTRSMSKLRTSGGVEYAPWMGITESDEKMIRSMMREKTEARRKRQEQERNVSGNLYRDSQAQELSGTGLSYKIIDGSEVELTWATKTETNTKGFIVKRRAAKTNDYSVIASYNEYGPLMSKGKDGGVYRYLDSSVTPGGWVYRISEEDNMGNEADVCQCLVEVETADEQKAAVIAGVGFAVVALAAFVAGIAMDPMNGY
ncbi:hypothetical protein ACHAWU_004149 [Discostella pseudostelligera]|uniref:Uncharacterized protein n=1 Tax=Discostella pseudostelligera TaxID=259834 RepID=A0ABD3MQG6_9STRA